MDGREQCFPTAQTAEMRAEMRRGPLVNPPTGMSDQEIRARALECAVRMVAGFPPDVQKEGSLRTLLDFAHDFEAYIRDGVT